MSNIGEEGDIPRQGNRAGNTPVTQMGITRPGRKTNDTTRTILLFILGARRSCTKSAMPFPRGKRNVPMDIKGRSVSFYLAISRFRIF